MATRSSLAAELSSRLGDSGNAIWSLPSVKSYIDYAIKSLYPVVWRLEVAMTSATAGPLQPAPSGARRLHMVGHQRAGSTRVRPLRNWIEGDGEVFVPKTGIAGDTLVWGWTTGWEAPDTDNEVLSVPTEAEEIVLLRAHITALEQLLSDRVSVEKFHALQVRPSISEEDLATTLDALHLSLSRRLEKFPPLPEVQR